MKVTIKGLKADGSEVVLSNVQVRDMNRVPPEADEFVQVEITQKATGPISKNLGEAFRRARWTVSFHSGDSLQASKNGCWTCWKK